MKENEVDDSAGEANKAFPNGFTFNCRRFLFDSFPYFPFRQFPQECCVAPSICSLITFSTTADRSRILLLVLLLLLFVFFPPNITWKVCFISIEGMKLFDFRVWDSIRRDIRERHSATGNSQRGGGKSIDLKYLKKWENSFSSLPFPRPSFNIFPFKYGCRVVGKSVDQT